MAHAIWLQFVGLLCALFSSSAEQNYEAYRQHRSGTPSDVEKDSHESKTALLRQKADSSVLHAELFAKELSHILNIDKIAGNPSLQTSHKVHHKNKAVDAELHKLHAIIGTPNSTTDADSASAIRHAQSSIRTLLNDEMHRLQSETREESDAALQAARGVEDTGREIARAARAEADDYARAAHNSRAAADEADDLSRRAEDAAVTVERKGEALTVRIVDALRDNLEEAEANARHEADGQHDHIARIVHAHAATASLLEAGEETYSIGTPALCALAGAACLGIAIRSMTRKPFVELPTELLG